MLRWFYIRLLWAHPAEFRYRFCDGMLEAFDQTHGAGAQTLLLFDGLRSLFRQHILRSEFQQPWQPATAGPAYEEIRFHQIEPYKPRGIALAEGGVLAILLLVGVVNAINHGGGKVRNFLIGMHRPGIGFIKVDRASMEGGPLNTTVEGGQGSGNTLRLFERSYFRILRVLSALDINGDLTLSPGEILNAPAALSSLDLDHDGTLSPEECGFLPPGDFEGTPKQLAQERSAFMLRNLVLAALDSDHDGKISAAEIAGSSAALQSLDFNHDLSLSGYELMPYRAVSQAAGLMTRFDAADSGVISFQAVSDEDSDADLIRGILKAADRNRDGFVTRGELIVQLALHGLRAHDPYDSQ